MKTLLALSALVVALSSCADQSYLIDTEGARPTHSPNLIIVDGSKVVPILKLDDIVVTATRTSPNAK